MRAAPIQSRRYSRLRLPWRAQPRAFDVAPVPGGTGSLTQPHQLAVRCASCQCAPSASSVACRPLLSPPHACASTQRHGCTCGVVAGRATASAVGEARNLHAHVHGAWGRGRSSGVQSISDVLVSHQHRRLPRDGRVAQHLVCQLLLTPFQPLDALPFRLCVPAQQRRTMGAVATTARHVRGTLCHAQARGVGRCSRRTGGRPRCPAVAAHPEPRCAQSACSASASASARSPPQTSAASSNVLPCAGGSPPIASTWHRDAPQQHQARGTPHARATLRRQRRCQSRHRWHSAGCRGAPCHNVA